MLRRTFTSLVSLVTFASQSLAVTVTITGGSDVGEGGRWLRQICAEWSNKTGNEVTFAGRPNSVTDTLGLYRQQWAGAPGAVDIYSIDVVWQAVAAPYAVDLRKYFSASELSAYFSSTLQNNTINGQLVSVPTCVDVGLLYYRTDLLAKYGFSQPPETWSELAHMAEVVIAGERRAGNSDLWGYVWQGRCDEGLTVNAIEWFCSAATNSVPKVNASLFTTPSSRAALLQAKDWINRISPLGVTTYAEEECRHLFESGNALFMRNWPYVYRLATKANAVQNRFAICPLPCGSSNGIHTAMLGGWSLMLSKSSRQPEAAIDLIRFLSSAEVQKRAAIDLGLLPSRPALYDDPDVLKANPWFASVPAALAHACLRPSTEMGVNYPKFSTACFQALNRFFLDQLSVEATLGEMSTAARQFSNHAEGD
jgi:trehalose/maltose transport system substrate-binding protein